VHELSITQSIVDAVCERAAGRPVLSVKVRVGTLTAVVPEAMRFCFGLVVEGTVAEGARLDIDLRPAATHCRTCGADSEITDPIVLCRCGSADVDVVTGRELQIVSMRVG
jgi:hydrogenase nickel incorporation protein HypA/HybF